MSQKSYDGKNALYLIPTPIGNLEDITYRSVRILKECDVLFSEDTRVTKILLNHHGIKKNIYPLHEHNEETASDKVISFLEEGKTVALVSDRGTPIISDPGYKCVKKVIDKGYHVISLPGATALIPALTSSGIEPSPFLFYGFLHNKSVKQEKELLNLKDYPCTIIFYEAPHRIVKTLQVMKKILGNRKISISREITKKYEEVYRGTIEEVLLEISDAKGEFVIVVSGKEQEEKTENPIELIEKFINSGMSEKEAIKEVSHYLKIPKNDIYQLYLKKKK